MMQHKRLKGKRIEYRPMCEAELAERERDAVYSSVNRMMDARARNVSVVAMARKDRPGFEDAARWVVATCKSGAEQSASASLSEQGIECWCPTERFRKPPRRGQKPVEIQRTIFRGYLFVRVVPDNEAFAGLLATGRLQGLMASGDTTYLMPERLMVRLMLALKKRQRKHMVAGELPPAPDLLGRKVVIRSGPFAEFLGTVRRVLEKRGEVVLDVPLFGGMTEMTIGVDSIAL